MVKNAGGNKSKRIGRKYVDVPDSKSTRYAIEQGEEYAVVSKIFGGTCQVICRDSTARICVIRKKFKGRGKRGSIISPGVWILVGICDWEASSDGKSKKCDLLEVYSPSDKDHLIQTCHEDLSVLKSACDEFNDEKSNIEFTNNHTSTSDSEADSETEADPEVEEYENNKKNNINHKININHKNKISNANNDTEEDDDEEDDVVNVDDI